MRKADLIHVLLAGVLAGSAGSAETEERLHHVRGKVRVIYSVTGESAVPNDDLDGNGTPDRVEDVALQVWAAHVFFCEHLGFPDPLKSVRFGKVDCIQVSIHTKEKINGLNGVAYRLAQAAKPVPEGRPGDRALVLAVANTVDPKRNPTPGHELFHLIQYGATWFGNGWFLEGMARWSEAAWRENGTAAVGLTRPTEWGPEDERTKELFRMRYDAAFAFWNPLALQCEKGASGAFAKQAPDTLRTLKYSDGSPVLHDAAPAGAAFMREVLEELGEADDRAQQEIGHTEWTLANQGAPENNRFLFEAVKDVLRRQEAIRENDATPVR